MRYIIQCNMDIYDHICISKDNSKSKPCFDKGKHTCSGHTQGVWLASAKSDVFGGGDVLVADQETVLVGVSQRTNEKGADPGAVFSFCFLCVAFSFWVFCRLKKNSYLLYLFIYLLTYLFIYLFIYLYIFEFCRCFIDVFFFSSGSCMGKFEGLFMCLRWSGIRSSKLVIIPQG